MAAPADREMIQIIRQGRLGSLKRGLSLGFLAVWGVDFPNAVFAMSENVVFGDQSRAHNAWGDTEPIAT